MTARMISSQTHHGSPPLLDAGRGAGVELALGVGDGLARFAMQMPETWQLRFQFRAILIPGRAAKSLAEHEAIVDAVRRHGPEHARIAMTQHLGQVIGTLRHAIVAQETLLGREVS